MYNIIELVKKLSIAEGDYASKLMIELGDIIKTIKNNKHKEEVTNILKENLETAIEKRKGSLIFLITLVNFDKEYISNEANSENPNIRESIAKGLMIIEDNYYTNLIKERLTKETSIKIKKWLLYGLKNINSKESIEVLENYTPEDVLFTDYNKLLDKKEKINSQKISEKNNIEIQNYQNLFEEKFNVIIENIDGLEQHYLKNNNLEGKELGNGLILLKNKILLKKIVNDRNIISTNIIIGNVNQLEKQTLNQILNHTNTYNIIYSNKIEKEKTIISQISKNLSDLGFIFSKKSLLKLKIINNYVVFVIDSDTKDYFDYLPASINRFVAQNIINLAKIKNEKDFFITDLCCGGGTFLVEAKLSYPNINCIGFDINEKAITLAKKNSKHFILDIELHNNDGTKTNLKDSTIDVVFGNLPFGNRVKEENIEDLYNDLIKEAKRILKKDGFALLYTTNKYLITKVCENSNLNIVNEIRINLKKVSPSVFIIQK
jgi:ubiquinone/menaquinone biosynthesis C-methylase UbiE